MGVLIAQRLEQRVKQLEAQDLSSTKEKKIKSRPPNLDRGYKLAHSIVIDRTHSCNFIFFFLKTFMLLDVHIYLHL